MKKLAVFFQMTEQEQKGFLMLLFVVALLLIFPLCYRSFIRDEPGALPQLSWVDQDEIAQYPKPTHDAALEKPIELAEKNYELTPFDPNNLPEASWRAMGFSAKQIRVIKNYESKGGRFYDAADVAKIYSISAADFQRIAPFLRFPAKDYASAPREAYKKESKPAKVTIQVDVNKADTTVFQALWGIGSVLSARIVKFRDRLGGFHSVEQVKEVYGISQETFDRIKSQLIMTDASVKQLAINSLSAEELAAHPYCSKKTAQLIIRYRDQHGAFTSIADFKNIYTLDAEFLRKIEPYLHFN